MNQVSRGVWRVASQNTRNTVYRRISDCRQPNCKIVFDQAVSKSAATPVSLYAVDSLKPSVTCWYFFTDLVGRLIVGASARCRRFSFDFRSLHRSLHRRVFWGSPDEWSVPLHQRQRHGSHFVPRMHRLPAFIWHTTASYHFEGMEVPTGKWM